MTSSSISLRLTCCCPGFRISLGIMNLGPVSPAKPHLHWEKKVKVSHNRKIHRHISRGFENTKKKIGFNLFLSWPNKIWKVCSEVSQSCDDTKKSSSPGVKVVGELLRTKASFKKKDTKSDLLVFMWLSASGQYMNCNATDPKYFFFFYYWWLFSNCII